MARGGASASVVLRDGERLAHPFFRGCIALGLEQIEDVVARYREAAVDLGLEEGLEPAPN